MRLHGSLRVLDLVVPLHAAPPEKLTFDGHTVNIKVPEKAAPGNPWLCVGEFRGHLKSLEDGLVERGWHVVYVSASNLFGSARAMDLSNKEYNELRTQRSLAPRPALLGISRGGLYVNGWTPAGIPAASRCCVWTTPCETSAPGRADSSSPPRARAVPRTGTSTKKNSSLDLKTRR